MDEYRSYNIRPTYKNNRHECYISNRTIGNYLTDQKFELDVKKGESVWMNIDPITLGQHIKITDLKAKLVYE